MAKLYSGVALSLAFCLGLGSAVEFHGLRPRPSRTEYSVTCFTETIGVGASLVSPDQIRRLFGPESDARYIVVEVGVYSKTREAFGIRQADFGLRNHVTRALVRPVDPRDIAPPVADKTLPEISTNQAVAGYLVFPVLEAAGTYYELDYKGNGAWLTLPLKP